MTDDKCKKLKACPFCGNENITLETDSVGSCVTCYKCGMGHTDSNWKEEYAIKTWNTRSSERLAKIEVLESVRNDINENGLFDSVIDALFDKYINEIKEGK